MKNIFVGLVFIGALIAIGILWFTIARPVVVLPRVRPAPGYSFETITNRSITSEDRRGKLTLYTFAYTRCGIDCQSIYDNLNSIDRALSARPKQTPPLDFITISIDPEWDTAEKLESYSLPFPPVSINWKWVTGEPAFVQSVVANGFELLYSPIPDGKFVFSPRYVLVDGEGIVRSELEGLKFTPDRFLEYLDILNKEISEAKGSSRLAYEAAHFFACYPH